MNDAEKGSKVPQLSDVSKRLAEQSEFLSQLRERLQVATQRIYPLPTLPSNRCEMKKDNIACANDGPQFIGDTLTCIERQRRIMDDISFIIESLDNFTM